jgi:hypothetical protein
VPAAIDACGLTRSWREVNDLFEIRRRRGPVGDRQRRDEVLLEARLDRGLDLFHLPHDLLDLAPRRDRQ